MNENRNEDGFDESLEEYIQLIRIEGQKALALAKSKINVDLCQSFETQALDLRNTISEQGNRLEEMQKDLDDRKEYIKRLNRQLGGLSRLAGSAKIDPLFKSLHSSDVGESGRSIITRWKHNASVKKAEREGSRVYITFYSYRLVAHVWNAWRVSARTQSLRIDHDKKLSSVIDSKDRLIDAAVIERDTLKAELENVRIQLEDERKRREEMMNQIKCVFKMKFDNLSSEMLDVISDPGPQSASGLPFVNYVGPAETVPTKPVRPHLSISGSKKNLARN